MIKTHKRKSSFNKYICVLFYGRKYKDEREAREARFPHALFIEDQWMLIQSYSVCSGSQ